MNKLSKDKRDKLILTCIGIVAVLGVLYTFVLSSQQDAASSYRMRSVSLRDKFYKNKKLVDRGPSIQDQLNEKKAILEEREKFMVPSGNNYNWMFKLVDAMRRKQGLGTQFFVDLTQPEISEVGLLPRFPYKAAVFGVKLSGQYHEIGKFIADFENTYPYMRVTSLRMQPEASMRAGAQLNGGAAQKLIADIKIMVLFKPANT
jgi:Tfp pilus assembly protein PilO